MAPADAPALRVEVVYAAGPHALHSVRLALPPGSRAADALAASGLLAAHGLVLGEQVVLSVWGRLAPADTPLRDHDRLELTRSLQVDPKEARRQRYRRQQERPLSGTRTR
jgi:uncharacterized protein